MCVHSFSKKSTVKRKKDSTGRERTPSAIPSSSRSIKNNIGTLHSRADTADEYSRREKRLRRFDNDNNNGYSVAQSTSSNTLTSTLNNPNLYSKHSNNNYNISSSSSSPAPPEIEAVYDPVLTCFHLSL